MSDTNRETIRHAPDTQAVKEIDASIKLPEPRKHGKWLIWDKTILSDITVSDCNDTIEGVCYHNHSLFSCLDECPAGSCGAGIFVKFSNGKTICAPLATGRHPDLNPLYRLRPQEYYDLNPELVQTSIFVNSEIYPFPPNTANTVFYGDVIGLHTANDKSKSIDTQQLFKDNQTECIVKKDGDAKLVLHPGLRFKNQFMHDLPMRYGQPFYLSILKTSFISVGIHDEVVWVPGLGLYTSKSNQNNNMFFFLEPPVHKKFGDYVSYSDSFRLIHANHKVMVNKIKTGAVPLELKSLHHKADKINDRYSFVSHMKGFTCQDDKCISVATSDITPTDRNPGTNDKLAGTYNGKRVYRLQGCWDECSRSVPKSIDTVATKQPSPPTKSTTNGSDSSNQSLYIALIVLVVFAAILLCICTKLYLSNPHYRP